MKWAFLLLLLLTLTPSCLPAADIAIPEKDIKLIKTADFLEVSGTNELGGRETFTIRNAKAIGQFVKFLTSDRYYTAPKALKPKFKTLSYYKVRLLSKNVPVFELTVIGNSVLDIPNDPDYYVQADRYSDNIMFPLVRLQ